MKILVTAANGQLGYALSSRSKTGRHDMIGLTRQALDITDPVSVETAFQQHRPDILVNTAAYTAVDKAESEPEAAYLVNKTGPENLARACQAAAIPLIHISTDYVYSGEQAKPYTETDSPGPLNVYGASKLAGDEAVAAVLDQHLILRSSWIFGQHGNNFVKTMLRLGKERDELGVIDDQHGCPTAAEDIAETVLRFCDSIDQGDVEWGLYHYGGQPATTWFGFASAIFDRAKTMGFDLGVTVKPIPTRDYPTPAKRPKLTILDCSKIKKRYNIAQPDWQHRLDAIIQDACSGQN